MDGVIWLVLLQLTPAMPGVLVADAEGVQVRTQVRASVYTYEVVNLSSAPIREVEIPYSDGYNLHAPEGWAIAADNGVFRATANAPWRAIAPGRSARFSLRVTSSGGVLGHVDARLGAIGSAPRTVSAVWGVVPLPRSYVLLVAAVVFGIAALHCALLARSERARPRPLTVP